MTCPNCDENVAADVALCPSCGMTLSSVRLQARFGSKANDGWIGGVLSFLVTMGLLFGGLMLGNVKMWIFLTAYGLAFFGGLLAFFLIRKRYPTLAMGILVGTLIGVLNPLSLCFGIIGLGAAFGS
jgi:hypothetical protein